MPLCQEHGLAAGADTCFNSSVITCVFYKVWLETIIKTHLLQHVNEEKYSPWLQVWKKIEPCSFVFNLDVFLGSIFNSVFCKL